MVGITHKGFSLRKAIAEATLSLSAQEAMEAIRNKTVPKGDPFEFSRAAGLLAIKKTSDTIPDCHPLPVEFAAIRHRIQGMFIIIEVEVHAIYRTGVEVEAMHGAAITALTIYDMLKPLDKGIEIRNIRLIKKTGGKTDLKKRPLPIDLRTTVLVCSDRIAGGSKTDASGKKIIEKLEGLGISTADYEIIPDDPERIRSKAREQLERGTRLLIFTGGTGLSPRDNTPDTIEPLLTKKIPGIMELARQFGQERMPFAMLSRGIAGFMGQMLILTFPGSLAAVDEYMNALFPQILHVFSMAAGEGHDSPSGS